MTGNSFLSKIDVDNLYKLHSEAFDAFNWDLYGKVCCLYSLYVGGIGSLILYTYAVASMHYFSL